MPRHGDRRRHQEAGQFEQAQSHEQRADAAGSPGEVLPDAGCCSEEKLAAPEERGIVAHVAFIGREELSKDYRDRRGKLPGDAVDC